MKLNNVYPKSNQIGDTFYHIGVFSDMISAGLTPIFFDDLTEEQKTAFAKILDCIYYDMNSGEKTVSELIRNTGKTAGILNTIERQFIASLIVAKFNTQWNHRFALLKAEYNPIANVESDETFTTTTQHGHIVQTGRIVDNTYNEQTAHTGTESTNNNLIDSESTDTMFGYNSSTGVPAGKTESTHSGNNTRVDNLTDTHTGTNGSTANETETNSGVDIVTEQRQREGNIGVTMTQQMLQAENEFWSNFDFYKSVFDDIDSVLTISVYETEF